MARTTQARYASKSAVSGTSALDPRYYSRYGTAVPVEQPQRRTRPQEAPKRRPAPRTAPQRAPQAAPKHKKGYGVSLFAVFGFMAVAVLVVFVLLQQVRYEEVRSEAVSLQAELKELTELERRLRIQYEDAFDVTRVEEYATGVLGMTKPSSTGSMGTIEAPAQDKALVVMTEEMPEQSRLSAFISSVLAYFK